MEWKKSTYSMQNDCVEWVVDHREGKVMVRHSKQREGSQLSFTALEWEAFVRGVKDGQADL